MNTEGTKVDRGFGRATLEFDIRDAALSNGGVLITGHSEAAEAIAWQIHLRGVANRRPFEVVDCSDPDCLGVLDRHDEPAGGTLLLRDVDRLSPPLQGRLLAQIVDGRWRFMASSRGCPMARLEPALFYHLNVVYIALDAAN